MKGATTAAAGSAGLVPAPAAAYNTRFLRGDGIWADPTTTAVEGNIRYNESEDKVQIYYNGAWVDWRSGGLVAININEIPIASWTKDGTGSFTINPFYLDGSKSSTKVKTLNGYEFGKYTKICIQGNIRTHQSTDSTNAYLKIKLYNSSGTEVFYYHFKDITTNDRDVPIDTEIPLTGLSEGILYYLEITCQYYTSGAYSYANFSTFKFLN